MSDQIRGDFEYWAKLHGFDMDSFELGETIHYNSNETYFAWLAWKAAFDKYHMPQQISWRKGITREEK